MSSHQHLLGGEINVPLDAVVEIRHRVEDRTTQVYLARGPTITIDQQYIEDFADLAHHLVLNHRIYSADPSEGYRCPACTPKEKQ